MTASYAFVFLEVFSREGGIQSYVQDVLAACSQLPQVARADVFLLRDRPCELPPRAGSLRFHGLYHPWAAAGRLRLALVLGWHLWRHRPQRVICGHINLAPLVQHLCRWLGLRYTVMTYGKEVWEPLPRSFQRSLLAADSLWTISRYSRELACRANGLTPASIQMLPCVVDGQRFSPGAAPAALVERYSLGPGPVLMTVARLWPGDIYKGVDVTIRALPAIATQFPTVRYLVIGRGDDQPRLARLAQELGVAERVVFAGFVPTDELPDHYRLADAYVMPSQEGFGIVYLEAMACGVPVLAGNSDGSADPLQDGRLGWQVPHRDPAAVAAACIEMLTGKELRCKGLWLRQECLARFSQSALVKRLGALL